MKESSPQSPEARRKRLAGLQAAFGRDVADNIRPTVYPLEIAKRVAVGVYTDGFIHAGNLAYLAMLALFPFFIVAAALAHLIGRTQDGALTVSAFLGQLPPTIAATLRTPVHEVLTARTGPLLWLGALVGLWTATSFIETIRDILRRAYGVKFCRPFWEYRLWSIGLILVAVMLLMIAFALTVLLTSAQHAIEALLPFSAGVASTLGMFRVVPGATLFATFYFLFFALTPARYRKKECRKWPGALLVTAWWMATVEGLPFFIGLLGGYNLTYGSLAGVMIVLLFFFVIGLGVVMGAELNAALADSGATALKGEIYSGPFRDELDVEEPQPGEDVVPELETVGAKL